MKVNDPEHWPIHRIYGMDSEGLTPLQVQALRFRELMYGHRREQEAREQRLEKAREQVLREQEMEQAQELRRDLNLARMQFEKSTDALREQVLEIRSRTLRNQQQELPLEEWGKREQYSREQEQGDQAGAHTTQMGRNRSLVSPLTFFRFFCDKPNRQNLELVAADMSKDIVEMRAEGHSELYVRAVVWWQIVTTLGDLVYDTVKRRIGRLFLVEIVRRFFAG